MKKILLIVVGMSVLAATQVNARAVGCVIKNTTGVMNVTNPKLKAGSRNIMEYTDTVDSEDAGEMKFWPRKTLFCQNGTKTTPRGVSGTCQLKPARNKSGGNNIWKLLCTK